MTTYTDILKNEEHACYRCSAVRADGLTIREAQRELEARARLDDLLKALSDYLDCMGLCDDRPYILPDDEEDEAAEGEEPDDPYCDLARCVYCDLARAFERLGEGVTTND